MPVGGLDSNFLHLSNQQADLGVCFFMSKKFSDFENKIKPRYWIFKIGQKYPKLYKPVIFLSVIFGVFIVILPIYSILQSASKVKGEKTENITNQENELGLGDNRELPNERRNMDVQINNQCDGAIFYSPINDFKPYNRLEIFNHPDSGDLDIVNVDGTRYSQASVVSSFGCPLPLVATASATLIRGKSMGFFLEFENVIKVIIGDGDRRFIDLKVNRSGKRSGENSGWVSIFDESGSGRPKLSQEIEWGTEVNLVVSVRSLGGDLEVGVQVYRNSSAEPIEFVKRITPNFNPRLPVTKKFILGVNESKYHGKESDIKMGSFSVKSL